MARRISPSIVALLNNHTISTFYIVDIATAIPIKHTTMYRDVDTPFGTYLADNGLLSVDAPRLASNVDREAYKLAYTDPTFSMRSSIESGIAGSPIITRVGFVNTSGATLYGTPPGEICNNPEDYITLYSGVVEFPTIIIQDEEVKVVLECSSPMSNLSLVNSHFTSQDYMRNIDRNDTSFDQVYLGSRSVKMLWGKR